MSEAKVVVNYTDEQTTFAVNMYTGGTAVEKIAEMLGKTTRSVIAKLVSEGVYKANDRTKSVRVTKAEMVATLEQAAGVEAGAFKSFEKADKAALHEMASTFMALRQAYDIVAAEGQ